MVTAGVDGLKGESSPKFVMAGLDPAIHALERKKVVDARLKAGHDE